MFRSFMGWRPQPISLGSVPCPGAKGEQRHRCSIAINVAKVLDTTILLGGQGAASILSPRWKQRRKFQGSRQALPVTVTVKGVSEAITAAAREGVSRVSKHEAMLRNGSSASVETRRWWCPPGRGSRQGGLGPRETNACVKTNVCFYTSGS